MMEMRLAETLLLKEENDKLKKEVNTLKDKLDTCRITFLQYRSLRRYYRELENIVLGENYYNSGLDTYTCDRLALLDIGYKVLSGRKYKKLKSKFDEIDRHIDEELSEYVKTLFDNE